MYWNSVGGVKLKGPLVWPRFVMMVRAARKAALAREACIKVDLFRRGGMYFVLSVWTEPEEMKGFVKGDTHGEFIRQKKRMFEFADISVVRTDHIFDREETVIEWEAACLRPQS